MTTTSTATETAAQIFTDVPVEDAPLGVVIWPCFPGYEANFTIERVEVVRDINGTWVRWIYESGKTRTFSVGEVVACILPA